MYNLCVSNICFEEDRYDQYYCYLQQVGIKNIEIAPTKLFGSWEVNLDSISEIKKYDFTVSSMQSLFYEKDFNFFHDEVSFLQHFDKIFEICKILSCEYVVFGSPKNRLKPSTISEKEAYEKFNKIIQILFMKIKNTNINIGIELNPEQYNCNFFNSIEDIQKINFNKKIKFHFDTGCISLTNNKISDIFSENKQKIKNIHISQPGLSSFSNIQNIKEHVDFANLLNKEKFNGFVSLEMKSSSFQDFKVSVDNFIKIYK